MYFFLLKKQTGCLGVGKGDGGPNLLGALGLSHRIVPFFYFTITYFY